MRRSVKWLWGVLAVVVAVIVGIVTLVNPVVFDYAAAQLDAITVQALNAGVADVVTADTYPQLTDVRRDSQGVITSITANAVAMNRVAAQVSTAAQEHLVQLGNTGVPIPIGTFSGLPILVGKGLPVMLKINLVGSVNCRFDSTLASAGINQTQHKILLYLDAVVDVILPLGQRRTQIAVQMLFADSIIVGKVPEFMLTA